MNNINKLSIFEKKLRKSNFETINIKWYLLKASLINFSFVLSVIKEGIVYYNSIPKRSYNEEKKLRERCQMKSIIENIMEL